jgi:hypothetical protein
MKTNSSSYVLAAEILTIILLHAVKIRQAEKHAADTAQIHVHKKVGIHQPVAENKSDAEYMLVNLVR